jgi:WD40 repeat protein/serine/threonine protein kinase
MDRINPFTGHIINHYRVNVPVKIDRVLSVYEAHDMRLEQPVWVHILLPGFVITEDFQHDFSVHMKSLRALEHSRLLPIVDYGNDAGIYYFVTPAISATPLSGSDGKHLAERDASSIMAQVCEGLDYLHQNQVAHANLCPENILLSPSGEIILTGYGLINWVNHELVRNAPEKMLGLGAGNVAYLAPENIAGREADTQSDLYALGAVYFRFLTGQDPFQSQTWTETALKRMVVPIQWPAKLQSHPSNPSIRFIQKCLSIRPSEQFKNAAEARKILVRISEGRYTYIPLSRSQAKGAPLRYLQLRALVGLLILALLVGMIYWGSSASPQLIAELPTTFISSTLTVTVQLPVVTPESPTRTPAPQKTIWPVTDMTPTDRPFTIPVFESTLIPGEAKPIIEENIEMIQEVSLLGFGRLYQAAWQGQDGVFAVATAAGVYIFDDLERIGFIDTREAATSVQFSNDGITMAVGLMNGDIQLWDWQAEEKLGTLTGKSGKVNRILFSPMRGFLISAGADLHIHIWNLNQMTIFKSLPAHQYAIQDIAITPDGFLLASCDRNTGIVKLWDMQKYTKILEVQPGTNVHAVAFSPDGRYLAAGGFNGSITQWVVDSILNKKPQFRSNPIPINGMIWDLYYDKSGDNLHVGLGGGDVQRVNTRENRTSWRPVFRPTEIPKRLLERYGADFDFSSNMAVNLNNNATVTVHWDGSIKLSNRRTLSAITQYDDFTTLDFSPNSQFLLAGGVRDTAYLWDLKQNKLLGMRAARVPDGRPFSASSDHIVLITEKTIRPKNAREQPRKLDVLQVFDSPDFAPRTMLSEFPQGAHVQYLMDDRLLAAGTRTETKLWDTASSLEIVDREESFSGCRIARSQNNDDILSILPQTGILHDWDDRTQQLCKLPQAVWNRLAVPSSDRRLVAFINPGGQLEMLNIDVNQSLWKQETTQPVTAIAFSQDNELLVTGATDGAFTFWNVSSGMEVFSFRGHFDVIRAVAFSPDGKIMASSSRDGTVRIWEVIH